MQVTSRPGHANGHETERSLTSRMQAVTAMLESAGVTLEGPDAEKLVAAVEQMQNDLARVWQVDVKGIVPSITYSAQRWTGGANQEEP